MSQKCNSGTKKTSLQLPDAPNSQMHAHVVGL